MIRRLLFLFMPFVILTRAARQPELPLCPTNMSFLPQKLPMHCRMPMPPRLPNIPGAPPGPPAYPYPPQLANPGGYPGGFPGMPQSSSYGDQPGAPGGPFANPYGAPPGPPGSPYSGPPGASQKSGGGPSSGSNPSAETPGGGPAPPPSGAPPGFIPGMIPGFGPGMSPGFPAGMPPPPPGFPMAMPMALPMGGPKLPVVVMPFYSPDPMNKNKKKRPRPPPPTPPRWSSDTDTTSTDTSSDTSSSSSRGWSDGGGWWNDRITRHGRVRTGRRNARRNGLGRRRKIQRKGHRHVEARRSRKPIATKERVRPPDDRVLTPMLQYVNKDGYVIFEKKISKGEAKDWLKEAHDGKENENKEEYHSTLMPPAVRRKTTAKVIEIGSPEEAEMSTKIAKVKSKRRQPVRPGRL